MSNTLIGAGGTGAKILESFVFLSFAGLPEELGLSHEIHLRMVDTDEKGGNLDRLKTLLAMLYGKGGVYSKVANNSYFAKGTEGKWIPANLQYERLTAGANEKAGSGKNANDFRFHWNIALTDIKNLDSLIGDSNIGNDSTYIKTLYSETDRQIPLDEGCHGKPRLGALIYDYYFREDTKNAKKAARESFWDSLHSCIAPDITAGTAKIMFAGSMFGGTGASGIPILARCFSKEYLKNTDNNSVGMALMLPYFTYKQDADCPATPDEFALNSKIALRYYRNSDFLDDLKNVNPTFYFIGQPPLTMTLEDGSPAPSKRANGEQLNPAIPAEAVAAFSAMHYFYTSVSENSEPRVHTVKSGNTDEIGMNNLPEIGIKREVKKAFGKSEITKQIYLRTAIQRLKMFAQIWKLLKKQPPKNGSRVYAYHSLTEMLRENGNNWDTEDELGRVDAFAESLYKYLLQLELNGLSDLGVKKFDGDIKDIDENANLNVISIGNTNAEEIYIKINDATKSFRGVKSDYTKLFFAVMKVCGDTYKY